MKMKILLAMVAILFAATAIVNAQEKSCCEEKTKSECTTTTQKSDCGTKTGNSQGTADSTKLCPVSGEPVNHEGASVKFTYLAKEYEFCCAGCLKKFKAEPMTYIKTELTCPVMGEAASKDVTAVVDGVKYYFCCEGCISKFEKNPKKYLDKIK
jgi:YHS domain-containing protein